MSEKKINKKFTIILEINIKKNLIIFIKISINKNKIINFITYFVSLTCSFR